jgi:hypothetical protein
MEEAHPGREPNGDSHHDESYQTPYQDSGKPWSRGIAALGDLVGRLRLHQVYFTGNCPRDLGHLLCAFCMKIRNQRK